jgi:hypothetical protein
MPQAWWAPVIEIPGDVSFGRQHATLLNRERTLPRSILVNKLGRRFTNEAANYNALGGALHQLDAARFDYVNLPCWLVFDAEYLARYGFRDVRPSDPAPAWITQADSLDGLAAAIGAPTGALTETVTRWNTNVGSGDDPDFHRGRSAYDLWSGDAAARGRVASTLGPVNKPPYYAVEVRSGTLGTSGGPRTDLHGRVLDTRGKVIPGLFAAGNVAAAPTGMVYGGAGGTLGPIITFAYRAGVAASRPSDPRRAMGSDHPITLASQNGLAFAYKSAGQVQQAISLYEETMTTTLRVSGKTPPRQPGMPAQNSLQPTSRRVRSSGRSGRSSRHSPSTGGCWATTTPSHWDARTTSPMPTRPQMISHELSRSSSGPWPTGSGYWVRTIPTR